ncbi:ribonuclease HII [Metamycoplasma cloacale]|uniref:Ribonuclease n=1 Tax=Metamycoplasma cloacale TaxID=92401 RepID=A0A2Z4LMN8_9BACT|nr:ribonuclease HIII [Metamycoplasma cloacale]AWX42990.1 ribonuclease HIII [Metamycoplasma cloacale]VEU79186.1 ribonuclease HII [Metamycoplasma cloacale]
MNYNEIIGVDETGVGDYFGPIVSVACYIPNQHIDLIKQLNVKDSKKLTDKKILEIVPTIMKLVYYKQTILTQDGYNKLIKAKINNNEIKTLIHSNTLNNFINAYNVCNTVLIDQYTANNAIFEKHYQKLQSIPWLNVSKPKLNIILETKAEDKSLAVACASIIARAEFLKYMNVQNQKYNIEFKLGASNKVDEQAALFIQQHGITELSKVAKISFKTTQKALDMINDK